MADNQAGLFRKLTQLFRSGPTIKRRVRDFDSKSGPGTSSLQAFRRAHSDVYTSTMSAYGSFDRMARYSDFSEMEATPEIASALDIYAEESASSDERGTILHIHSDNRKIKELLDTLFIDTLNINFNLPMWVRNLCKYGDFFLFNDVSPEFGVIGAYPIPISEIEREEGFDPKDPTAVRFKWMTQGNQTLENWQVTHFRLLGNDAFLPYGSSVLESARRIWRQLILIEDAMLVYRVIRSPERRVFYIDVGNVPPENVAEYLEQAKNSLKRSPVVNKTDGRVDLRFNPLSVDEDYFIPVRGGDSGTKIDTLAGGQNTTAIEDVEYIQKKLFSALKVPKAYLGYDEMLSSKATLAQEDIRFSRTITRIQKTVVAELNKLAMVHLYAHGFQVYTRELTASERITYKNTKQINLLDSNELFDFIKSNVTMDLDDEVHKVCDESNTPNRAISLMWNQRSADTFLGLPFNIASYGLLLEFIAKAVNMVPDELIGNLGDTHLYSNHIEQAEEQIGRELRTDERVCKAYENHKLDTSLFKEGMSDSELEKVCDSFGIPKTTRDPYTLPKLNINTEWWPYEGGSCGEGPIDAVSVFNSFKDDNFCRCLLEEQKAVQEQGQKLLEQTPVVQLNNG